jgi:S-adenosylmethionine/arginine decarboxylase-like enzyme
MDKLLMVQVRQAVLGAIIDYDRAGEITSEQLESILTRAAKQVEAAVIESKDKS